MDWRKEIHAASFVNLYNNKNSTRKWNGLTVQDWKDSQ